MRGRMVIYKVGGSVRDGLLGRKSNDHDFSFVIEDGFNLSIEQGYSLMKEYMLAEGYTIFLETPECLTIRGRMPDGMVGDFVLARKEFDYIEGTRKPIVKIGNLKDDLERRDFTVNALASDENNNLIDMFNGINDLNNKILRTPLDPMITLRDDPLRALRAVRFSITLDFDFHPDLQEALNHPSLPLLTKQLVSTDRIRQELSKCFKYNTWHTYAKLTSLSNVLVNSWLGKEGLWLKPTTEK